MAPTKEVFVADKNGVKITPASKTDIEAIGTLLGSPAQESGGNLAAIAASMVTAAKLYLPAAPARIYIKITTDLVAAETITITDGAGHAVVFTAIDTGEPAAGEFLCGTDAATTQAALLAAIQANATLEGTATASGDYILFTDDLTGPDGDGVNCVLTAATGAADIYIVKGRGDSATPERLLYAGTKNIADAATAEALVPVSMPCKRMIVSAPVTVSTGLETNTQIVLIGSSSARYSKLVPSDLVGIPVFAKDAADVYAKVGVNNEDVDFEVIG